MKAPVMILIAVIFAACGTGNQSLPQGSESQRELSLRGPIDFCQQLTANQTVQSFAEKELDLLCRDDYLTKLIANTHKTEIIEQRQTNISHVTVGNFMRTRADLAKALSVATLYCQDFPTYRSYFPEEVYARVEGVYPENISEDGCDFDFVGHKILFYQPRYKGKSVRWLANDGRSYVSLDYLTDQVSMIERAISLTLVQQTGDELRYWNLHSFSADSKGFHDTLVQEMERSDELTTQTLATILKN